jgi:hypothetical protein
VLQNDGQLGPAFRDAMQLINDPRTSRHDRQMAEDVIADVMEQANHPEHGIFTAYEKQARGTQRAQEMQAALQSAIDAESDPAKKAALETWQRLASLIPADQMGSMIGNLINPGGEDTRRRLDATEAENAANADALRSQGVPLPAGAHVPATSVVGFAQSKANNAAADARAARSDAARASSRSGSGPQKREFGTQTGADYTQAFGRQPTRRTVGQRGNISEEVPRVERVRAAIHEVESIRGEDDVALGQYLGIRPETVPVARALRLKRDEPGFNAIGELRRMGIEDGREAAAIARATNLLP